MPLFPDATALIALGAIDLLPLLPTIAGDVVIGRHVRAEVVRAAAALDVGIEVGWLRVESVNDADVMALQQLTGLDEGESEVILLAARFGGMQRCSSTKDRPSRWRAASIPSFGCSRWGMFSPGWRTLVALDRRRMF